MPGKQSEDLSHLRVVGPRGETVGQVVDYVAYPSQQPRSGPPIQPRLVSAIISIVHADGNPDLSVLPLWNPEHVGYAHGDISRVRDVPHSPTLREGHWSWREGDGGMCPKHHLAYHGLHRPIPDLPEVTRTNRLAELIRSTHALGQPKPNDPQNLLWIGSNLYSFASKTQRAEAVAQWCYNKEHGTTIAFIGMQVTPRAVENRRIPDLTRLEDGVEFLGRRMDDRLLAGLLEALLTRSSEDLSDLLRTVNDLLRFLERDEIPFDKLWSGTGLQIGFEDIVRKVIRGYITTLREG